MRNLCHWVVVATKHHHEEDAHQWANFQSEVNWEPQNTTTWSQLYVIGICGCTKKHFRQHTKHAYAFPQ